MPDGLKIRVLLADDHALVRSGLRMLLEAEPDIEVVAEAADGCAALRHALSTDVDLAILDVSMPGMTGIQVAEELRAHRPGVRMLMLSMHEGEHYLFEALRAGASGYVLKSAFDNDLVEACRATMRGEPFLYPTAITALIRDCIDRERSGEAGRRDPLSPRETQVLKLVAEGCTTREVAEKLILSERTVERHRANLMSKLGMHNRVELTRYAIRRGLVSA